MRAPRSSPSGVGRFTKLGFYFHLGQRILFDKLRRRVGLAAIPYKVQWNATYCCNSRCTTCNIWQIYAQNGASQKDEIGQAQVSRIVSSLGKHLLWLTVTGGEPTLKCKVAETVNDIYDACPRLGLITINTNGLLPDQTEKVLRAIASHCRRAETIAVLSLDALGRAHDEIRGVPGSFEAVLNSHRRLTELRKHLPNLGVTFMITVSSYNLDQVSELLEFCRARGDSCAFTFAGKSGYYRNLDDGDDIIANRSSFPGAFNELVARLLVRNWMDLPQWCHVRLMKYFMAERQAPVPCCAGSSSITLSPTGEVFGCLFRDNEGSMGSAAAYGCDLLTLLRTERARCVQRDSSHCHQCWTNCQSIPAMMSSPLKTLRRILTSSRNEPVVTEGGACARC